MDHVGHGISSELTQWTFSGNVAENFDEHVRQSVPFYDVGHDLICKLSDFFVTDDSVVYDVGCSTGRLLSRLATRHGHRNGVEWVGIDAELDMVQYASKATDNARITFIHDDVRHFPFQKSDFIVAYYTVQFVRPKDRQQLITKIYDSLNWGGALLLFEKMRGPDARFQDIATALYTEYKLDNRFSPDEIVAKSRSLKGVLEPFSTQGNLDMLTRAGFVDVMTVMKYVPFEGILAIK